MDLVVFQIGTERCLLELQQVEEVIRLGSITPVPPVAPGLVGAVNLRGEVLAVLDPPLLVATDRDRGPARGGPTRPGAGIGLLAHAVGCRVVLRVDRVEGVVREPDTGSPAARPLDLEGLLRGLLQDLHGPGPWRGLVAPGGDQT